jgi:hypothetical protein
VGSAEGVRYQAVIAGAPLTEDIADVGTPVAQSEVDSVGGSLAYAAAPYPGELVLTSPALATSATGLPAAPDYPLIASSRHPTEPESSTEQPGVDLDARSNATSSSAVAVTGGSAEATSIGRASAESTSTLDEATGTLTVEATSAAEVVQFQGLLRIGRVEGLASVTLAPGGDVERTSRVVVGDVTVAGISARITEDGVVLGDSASPLPGTGSQVDVLEDAGISARLIGPSETGDGIVSGALEVTVESAGPSGPVTQTYTFGRVSARVSSRAGPHAAAAPALSPGPVLRDAGDAAASPGGAPAGPGSTSTVADDGPLPQPAGGPPAQAPVLDTAPAATGFPLADTVSFYLTIVLAALTAIGAAQLVRIMGVRAAWIS